MHCIESCDLCVMYITSLEIWESCLERLVRLCILHPSFHYKCQKGLVANAQLSLQQRSACTGFIMTQTSN